MEVELWNFKSQYIPCAEAELRNFKSQYISCVEAELRNFKSQYTSCAQAELRNFKSPYIPFAEAELRNFKSQNIPCAEVELPATVLVQKRNCGTSSRSMFLVQKWKCGTSSHNIFIVRKRNFQSQNIQCADYLWFLMQGPEGPGNSGSQGAGPWVKAIFAVRFVSVPSFQVKDYSVCRSGTVELSVTEYSVYNISTVQCLWLTVQFI